MGSLTPLCGFRGDKSGRLLKILRKFKVVRVSTPPLLSSEVVVEYDAVAR